jgi:hypothetical protein
MIPLPPHTIGEMGHLPVLLFPTALGQPCNGMGLYFRLLQVIKS